VAHQWAAAHGLRNTAVNIKDCRYGPNIRVLDSKKTPALHPIKKD